MPCCNCFWTTALFAAAFVRVAMKPELHNPAQWLSFIVISTAAAGIFTALGKAWIFYSTVTLGLALGVKTFLDKNDAKKKPSKAKAAAKAAAATKNAKEAARAPVIVAGFGKTGTMSVQAALQQLGYKTFHGTTLVTEGIRGNLKPLDLWHDHFVAARRTPAGAQTQAPAPLPLQAIVAGYDAFLDFPISLSWEELAERFPAAKVILTTRDEQRWWPSWCQFWQMCQQSHVLFCCVPIVERYYNMLCALFQSIGLLQPNNAPVSSREAFASFRAHNAAVAQGVPKGRLLQFSVKDGWAPLAKFLGVSTPKGAFPFSNAGNKGIRDTIIAGLRHVALEGLAQPATTAAVVGAFAFCYFSTARDETARTMLAILAAILAIREHKAAGQLFKTPAGLEVSAASARDVAFLHDEIFADNVYFKHGITLDDDAVVVDCGANIGMFNIYIQQNFAKKRPRVFCFEPVGSTFSHLRRNCDRYGGTCLNYGLSDETMIVPFEIGNTNIAASGCPEFQKWRTENWHKAIDEGKGQGAKFLAYLQESIPIFKHLPAPVFRFAAKLQLSLNRVVRTFALLRPLSHAVQELGLTQIDLLKVDVEGAEMDVLRSLRAEDWKIVKQVVMEVQTHKFKDEATALLEKHGFKVTTEQDPYRPDYFENFELWAKKK